MDEHTRRDLLATAAAFDVPSDHVLPTRPVDDSEFTWLLSQGATERVLGPLAAAVASEAWPVTPDQRTELASRHRTWMSTALRIEAELLTVTELFAEHGIDVTVLKGPASAHLLEPDPSWRCFGDLDLLVPADRIADASALLVYRGGRRHYAEPRPGFDRRFSKGMAVTGPGRVEVDLHRTLTPGPFGLAIDLDELVADRDTFRVGDRDLTALGPAARFVHAAYHAVLGSPTPRLLPLRDLARAAPTTPDSIAAAVGLAHSWRGDAALALAVRTARARLGWRAPAPLAAWAESRVDDRREQRWLASSAGSRRSSAAQALAGIEAVPGLTAKLAYAYAVALPAGASRGRSRRDRWTRGRAALARYRSRT